MYFRDNALADAYNFRHTGTWSNQYSDSSHVSRVNPLLLKPLAAGKYTFPEDDFLDEIAQATGQAVSESSVEEGHLTVKGESKIVPYFRLKAEDYSFIFPGRRLRNSPLKVLSGQGYFSTYFATAYPIGVIPERDYRLERLR